MSKWINGIETTEVMRGMVGLIQIKYVQYKSMHLSQIN